MAMVTGVSLTLKRTVGLPNYSSLVFEAWANAAVSEDEDAEEALRGLAKMLNRALDEEQKEAGASKPGVTVVERILGRPVM